jgi:AcrR family transcriptional regulator
MGETTAPSTRNRILDAAEAVVVEDGVAQLTLDAVAARAAVSKGGLLYHFAGKDALVAGMVERRMASFERHLAERMSADPERPGRFARAFARDTFDATADAVARDAGVGSALLAALGTNPALLAPAAARYDAWQRRLEDDGVDPALATLARLAADGLFFALMFGLAPPPAELRGRVLERLLGLLGAGRTDEPTTEG